MKAEFLKAQFSNLYLVHSKSGIENILNKILKIRIRDVSSSEKSVLVSKFIDEIEDIINKIDMRGADFSYEIVKGGDIDRYLSKNFTKLLRDNFRDMGESSLFYNTVEQLKEKYNATMQKMAHAFFAFSEFGVETIDKDVREHAFIEINFPKDRKYDLEEFGRESSEQARILKLLSDSFFGTRIDFEVYAISSSRLTVFIKTNYKSATYFSAVVCFLLSSANSYFDIRIKQHELSELLESKIEDNVSDEIISRISKKCAEKVGEEFFDDAENALFSAEKCAAGAREVMEAIETGFRYSIHTPSDPENRITNESHPGLEAEEWDRLQELAKNIQLSFDKLPPIGGQKALTNESGE